MPTEAQREPGSRLRAELIARVDAFCHPCLDLAETLPADRVSRRVTDQMVGSGTSVGANLAEAAEPVSRKDFCKHIAIALKELSEVRFWLRLASHRGWAEPARAEHVEAEAVELKLILGSILTRTRRRGLSDKQ